MPGKIRRSFRGFTNGFYLQRNGTRRWQLLLQQVGISENNTDHVIVIVSHAAGQLSDGLHFLRLYELLPESFLFGNILDDPIIEGDPAIRSHRDPYVFQKEDFFSSLFPPGDLQPPYLLLPIRESVQPAKIGLRQKTCRKGIGGDQILECVITQHVHQVGIGKQKPFSRDSPVNTDGCILIKISVPLLALPQFQLHLF